MRHVAIILLLHGVASAREPATIRLPDLAATREVGVELAFGRGPFDDPGDTEVDPKSTIELEVHADVVVASWLKLHLRGGVAESEQWGEEETVWQNLAAGGRAILRRGAFDVAGGVTALIPLEGAPDTFLELFPEQLHRAHAPRRFDGRFFATTLDGSVRHRWDRWFAQTTLSAVVVIEDDAPEVDVVQAGVGAGVRVHPRWTLAAETALALVPPDGKLELAVDLAAVLTFGRVDAALRVMVPTLGGVVIGLGADAYF